MNLLPFLIGIGKDWYKPALWIILGAILASLHNMPLRVS